MPTLLDFAGELTGTVPGLPNVYARQYVNRAYHEVQREKLWTWNTGQGILACPQLITSSGTCTVTQFSETVTFDSVAQSVLNPLALATPPITQYQFRIGAGPVYSLLAYNTSTGVGTLDRYYGEATTAGTSFVMYKCYYAAPSLDGSNTPNYNFLRFLSILNPIQGYTIAGRRLNMSQEELNRRDPLRGAQGQPYYASRYVPTPIQPLQTAPRSSPQLGTMVYELWPHPTFQQNLIVNFEYGFADLNPGDYFPLQAPHPVILMKAQEYAFRWALANAGRVPELKGTDWRFLLSEVQQRFKLDLLKAKKEDDEIMPTILRPGSAGLYDFWGPIDSNFWQSHGLPAL